MLINCPYLQHLKACYVRCVQFFIYICMSVCMYLTSGINQIQIIPESKVIPKFQAKLWWFSEYENWTLFGFRLERINKRVSWMFIEITIHWDYVSEYGIWCIGQANDWFWAFLDISILLFLKLYKHLTIKVTFYSSPPHTACHRDRPWWKINFLLKSVIKFLWKSLFQQMLGILISSVLNLSTHKQLVRYKEATQVYKETWLFLMTDPHLFCPLFCPCKIFSWSVVMLFRAWGHKTKNKKLACHGR